MDEIIHQQVRLRIMAALNAVPDGEPIEFTRLKAIVQATDGNLVTTYKIYHGTHEGEFLGVPPTGRKIHFETVDAMRVDSRVRRFLRRHAARIVGRLHRQGNARHETSSVLVWTVRFPRTTRSRRGSVKCSDARRLPSTASKERGRRSARRVPGAGVRRSACPRRG